MTKQQLEIFIKELNETLSQIEMLEEKHPTAKITYLGIGQIKVEFKGDDKISSIKIKRQEEI
jgi:chaperonin cofactor prefoldin